jgi:hypothetical protein
MIESTGYNEIMQRVSYKIRMRDSSSVKKEYSPEPIPNYTDSIDISDEGRQKYINSLNLSAETTDLMTTHKMSSGLLEEISERISKLYL